MADHTAHDPALVAEAADRGRSLPPELVSCAECTALLADLVALAAALPSSAIPARPRDYTLTEADAARLRPRGWRRLFGAIGSSRDLVTRPLAIGLTTLGLAGLLVATVPGALPGGGATGALDTVGSPVEMPAAGSPAGDGGGGFEQSAPDLTIEAARTSPESVPLLSPLAIASVTTLAAGGGLFALRRIASRRAGVAR